MVNVLSIDVEDYWSIFSRDWLHLDAEVSSAVVENTEWFLQILAEKNIKATFFVLGEVAEKFPSLIKKTAEQGHEIASHGLSHKQVFKLSEEDFRQEVAESKKLLEDITGEVVLGFRAPAFSIMPQTRWALDVLAQEGFTYDSSVFPISGHRYGWPEFSQGICKIDLPLGRSIIEVPMSTVTILGKTLPAAGGGYFRHFPYVVTKWAIKHIQKKKPVIVYMHPYEIDIKPHLFDISHLSQKDKKIATRWHKIQIRNRNNMPKKINKLLSQFNFAPIKEIISKTISLK